MAQFPPAPTMSGFNLRKADLTDLDDIVNVHIDGFVGEPLHNYCYPLRAEYHDDHFKWLKREYQFYFENSQKFLILVAESEERLGAGDKSGIVGVAVWNLAVHAEVSHLDRGLDERRDANKKHVEAYLNLVGNRFKPGGTAGRWGEKQFAVGVLVVLPEFRRRKVGANLMNWGITHAREKEWPVSVSASPTGEFLYHYLHFVHVGQEKVQVEGEEDYFTREAFYLLPKEEEVVA